MEVEADAVAVAEAVTATKGREREMASGGGKWGTRNNPQPACKLSTRSDVSIRTRVC